MFLLIPNYDHSSIYHSFHHSHNSGNYASILTGLDTLCGTNKDYKQFKLEENKKAAQALIQLKTTTIKLNAGK